MATDRPKRLTYVVRLVDRVAATEGAGVRINRIMPTVALADLDPFLLLDEIQSHEPSAYLAGFPPHPHRGIETVTYMLAGRMHHRDSSGGDGVISAGDVQWMTAGHGIVHSEMPEQADGLMWGFQLWLNMPAAEKMTTPAGYRELKAADIPVASGSGARVRVIAGDFRDLHGPAPFRTTEPTYLDVSIDPHGSVEVQLPEGHAAFVYVYVGRAEVAGTLVSTGQAAVLGGEGPVTLSSSTGAGLLFAAALPIGEPVYRAGPFAMASQAALQETIDELRSGRFPDGGPVGP